MKIQPLASGSSGNCYMIKAGNGPLLIEAGLPLTQIKEGINFRLSDIEGVLISHEHQDHAKAVPDLMRAGKDIYMSPGTTDALNFDCSHHRINLISAEDQAQIGSWIVKALEARHDAQEPLNFLIYNQNTCEKLAYITDTFYCPYKFKGLTHIMIEANYSIDILDENIKNGRVPAVQKKRLVKTHFGLENVKGFLKANDLSTVDEIWLLHLSDRNSNEKQFKKEIQAASGKPTYIAGAGDH